MRAFAISSIIMMLFTLWMIMDDFGREWKGFQREFYEYRQDNYDEWIELAQAEVDQEAIDAARAKVVEMEKKTVMK